jgi:hypothetical protein
VSFAALVLLLNECLLFISSSTQSGNFWTHPRVVVVVIVVVVVVVVV